MKSLALIILLFPALSLAAEVRDCSEAYEQGQTATCEVVECSAKFETFLGTWKGPFQLYDRELGRYLKFQNTVVYKREDCLRNLVNGDEFIIGRKGDVYEPVIGDNGEILRESVTKTGLLITGRNGLGEKFLVTNDTENGRISYDFIFADDATETAIWQYNYRGSASETPMKITLIDGRDHSVPSEEHKRIVTVSMEGEFDSDHEGAETFLGGSGYHTLQKPE